jgi:hypothetical protein
VGHSPSNVRSSLRILSGSAIRLISMIFPRSMVKLRTARA